MRKIIRSAALLSLVCLSGCFSVDSRVLRSTGDEHVLVSNYGWWLFNCVPLLCGNATDEDERLLPWVFFRNDVTLEKAQAGITRYASERGGKITGLVYRNDNKVLMSVPGLGIPVPIPYLLCYREVQLSGVLK